MKEASATRKPYRAVAKRRIGRAAGPPAQKPGDAPLRESIDPDRRRAMVSEAAYFYAEHRGFEPGHEVEDWLTAESQIDSALAL